MRGPLHRASKGCAPPDRLGDAGLLLARGLVHVSNNNGAAEGRAISPMSLPATVLVETAAESPLYVIRRAQETELPAAVKSVISHRARAMRAILPELLRHLAR